MQEILDLSKVACTRIGRRCAKPKPLLSPIQTRIEKNNDPPVHHQHLHKQTVIPYLISKDYKRLLFYIKHEELQIQVVLAEEPQNTWMNYPTMLGS